MQVWGALRGNQVKKKFGYGHWRKSLSPVKSWKLQYGAVSKCCKIFSIHLTYQDHGKYHIFVCFMVPHASKFPVKGLRQCRVVEVQPDLTQPAKQALHACTSLSQQKP